MNKKISRIIGMIMLVVAIIFLVFALILKQVGPGIIQ